MNDMILHNITEVMIHKKGRVLIPEGKYDSKDDLKPIIATMAHIMLSRGFLLSDELVKALLTTKMSATEMAEYCQVVIKANDNRFGNRVYKPFYSKFPDEVMNADEATLAINAILHYMSGGMIVPNTNVGEDLYAPISRMFDRQIRCKAEDLTVLHPCYLSDFYDMCDNMMSSHTSITEDDKKALALMVECNPSRVPDDVPHKENKAIVIATMLRNKIFEHPLYNQTNSATDVLRIAAALSDGDVSLKENTRFISFSRPIRKWMMDTLECVPSSIAEEMLKHREKWLRIGERLHPRSFPLDEYERTLEAFDLLRNNESAIASYGSKVAHAFENKRFDVLIQLLSKKPGYFARELHHLFRVFPEKHYDIAVGFAGVANKVATPVLMQVYAYYKNKCFLSDTGIYFPKGNTQRIFVKTDLPVVPVHSEICNLILIACEHGIMSQLRERYVDEADENVKVYIDPELKSYLLPTSMRSAGKGLVSIPRGSRIKLGETKYVRPFIHWCNSDERIDVDLSVAFLDDNYDLVDRVSYYNLRNAYSCHSGDYTNAPKPDGASEFMDINIQKARHNGLRYAVITVHSFTEEKFREIPDCYVGYMTLTEEEYNLSRQGNKVYDVEKVQMKLDLTNDSDNVIVCVVDLLRNDIIWCDIAGDDNSRITIPNNVDRNKRTVSYVVRSVVEQTRANMYMLAKMTAKAKRHEIVSNPDEADILYVVNGLNLEDKTVVTASDMDVWFKMV